MLRLAATCTHDLAMQELLEMFLGWRISDQASGCAAEQTFPFDLHTQSTSLPFVSTFRWCLPQWALPVEAINTPSITDGGSY